MEHKDTDLQELLVHHTDTDSAGGGENASEYGTSQDEGFHDEEDLGVEQPLSWAAEENLDTFFCRMYAYWEGKGFTVIALGQVLNLVALAFTGLASGFLLVGVNYTGLKAPCLSDGSCSIWQACLGDGMRFLHPFSFWKFCALLYLAAFAFYWGFAMWHCVLEIRDLREMKEFYHRDLGYSERTLRAARWSEVASRIVKAQKHVRLCISRDLTEQDIVMRIMRKDNYMIGMLNKGVLALSIPGLTKAPLLTKIVEWNLRWCLLDAMFDESFRIKDAFLCSPAAVQHRFRMAAILNLILSPFLLVFLLLYFFMKNAESLYHQPGSIGTRQWSPAAVWQLREFNELPCFLYHRLNSGHPAAAKYVAQFPNHAISHIARLVAFVAGSVAAMLIALTLFKEEMLEKDLVGGKQTVWWLAMIGVVLAASRSFINEKTTGADDPNMTLLEVAVHTHHYPKHWRGRAHTLEVQGEMATLFRYKAAIFFEEIASILLTPILLWNVLPSCSAAIISFLQDNTAYVEGVGDVCSLSTFDMRKHGDTNYGSSRAAVKDLRSRHGKMEKSFVDFVAQYPDWEPEKQGTEILDKLGMTMESLATSSSLHHTGHPAGIAIPDVHGMWRFLISHYPHIAKIISSCVFEGGASPVLDYSDAKHLNNESHEENYATTSLHNAGSIILARQLKASFCTGEERSIALQSLLQYYHDNQEDLCASFCSNNTHIAQDSHVSGTIPAQEYSSELSKLN